VFEKRTEEDIWSRERETVTGSKRETDMRMEKNCKQGTLLVVLFTRYYTDYETRENEMGGSCGIWGKEEKAYFV
jgi:hypothetical protein